MTRAFLRIAAASCAALLLAGCSVVSPANAPTRATTRPSRLSLEEAKSLAQSTEDRIAASVPADAVASRWQLSKAHLLTCGDLFSIDEQTVFMWPGRTKLTLRPGVDGEELLKGIRSTWTKQTGYTVGLFGSRNGVPDVEIDGSNGDSYFVGYGDHGAAIIIASYSPCFLLPDGDDGEAH